MSTPNLHIRFLMGLLLAYGLAGCAVQQPEIYEKRFSEDLVRTQEAWSVLRQNQLQPDYVVDDNALVISTRSVPLARDAALPTHIKRVVFKFPGRHALPTLTERISREIGIPIILSPDALKPASSFVPGSGSGGVMGGSQFSSGGNQQPGGQTQAFSGGSELGALVVNASDYQRTFELQYEGPLDGLLDKLAALASLNWKYEDQRLIFYRTQTRSFVIKTLPGSFKLSSGSGGGSGGGSGLSGETENQTDFWTGLESNLKALLSSSGRMNLDKNAGYLVVTDSNEVLSLVEHYVAQMNQLMMRQITLEVEVVTVDLNEAHAAGIDWQAVSNLNIGSFTYLTPPAPATAGTPFSIEFAGINGKSALVRALQTFGQVSSAYSGVVVTSNRTPAPISVNNTFSYVRQTTPAVVSSGQAGAVAASSGLTPGQITTGTNIILLPMILESNQVLMQCSVSISSLKELTRFDSGSGASQQSVQLPNVDTFTMVQRMAIPSGKTMVVMGYDQARTGSNTNGPYGQLVTGKSGNGNKQSIVIMITPRISDI